MGCWHGGPKIKFKAFPAFADCGRADEVIVTRVLLELAGYAALLLWGLHMVQTGMLRGFGGRLRQVAAARDGR